MELIPNASRWYRMSSVQIMAAAGALQLLIETKPDLVATVLPGAWAQRATLVLMAVGIVARVIQQPSVSGGGGPGEPTK